MIYNTKHASEAAAARDYLSRLIEQGARVEVTHKRRSKSMSQRNYLHLLLGWVSICTGYTINELKQEFRSTIWASVLRYRKLGKVFYYSTEDLDTRQYTQITERLRTWSEEQLGEYLPAPNERAKLDSLANELEKWESRFIHA